MCFEFVFLLVSLHEHLLIPVDEYQQKRILCLQSCFASLLHWVNTVRLSEWLCRMLINTTANNTVRQILTFS